MATEFRLPELGENIEFGDVVRIAVTAGETIKEGQTVVELETDKAVVEVPSTVNGVIEEVKVTNSQQVKSGDVLFTYTPAEAEPAETAPAEAAKPEAETPAVEQPVAAAQAAVPELRAPAVNASNAEFRLPELGENIDSGDVVSIAVKPGDTVTEGQTVLELETDKAVVEVPSTLSGRVTEVAAKVGQKLKVGDVIFTAATSQPATPAVTTAPAQPEKAGAEPGEEAADQSYMAMTRQTFRSARSAEGKSEEEAFPPDTLPEIALETHPAGLEKHAGPEHRTVPASPIVRKLAREIGVDIYLVKGTGPGGRISQGDVKAFAKSVFAALAEQEAGARVVPGGGAVIARLPDFSRWGKIEKVSMRGVRRKTAEHLALAWNTIPHVTQFDKADITELEELRKRFAPKAEKAGGKMTMTAIALKVVASGLKAFPQFNASIDMAGEEIIYKRYFNIGVAVDTDRGLLVPVIRDVDKKNIIELAVELSAVSAKAREKKLTVEDMEGGSFTITNLGGVGGTAFTPIVNYPEVAILGISRSRVEPVWMNGKFEPRIMLPLSVSYDHRIIDGADAARFTRWIVDALEQPFLLSVQG
ncbi:MAG: branched-chain alpha-keto acid dehydrogenase subunit E2 [Acidobacteria bacterium]|nr:MAG: branched-chain alpha-keto acid dehydrogenase subunit E2 [Acidobacteriota bacterium]